MASLDELKIDRSRRGYRWIAPLMGVIGVIVIAGAGGLAAWRWWDASQVPVVRTVTVRQTVAGDQQPTVLNASGYVTARLQSTVSSKVTGRITEVLVEEGMAVREGQVLARLDDSTERARLALTEAQLQAQRGAVAEMEVRHDEAVLELERRERLLDEGIVGRAEFDTAKAEADSLRARIANQREQIIVAERQIHLQRTAIDDMVIRAPFSGVAISKDAQPGEMISPVSAGGGFTRTGICTLVDMSSLEIEVDVNESYIGRVEPEQRVVANLDAYPDWGHSGVGHHHDSRRGPAAGDRARADRVRRARGSSHPARHGRERGVPRGGGAGRRGGSGRRTTALDTGQRRARRGRDHGHLPVAG